MISGTLAEGDELLKEAQGDQVVAHPPGGSSHTITRRQNAIAGCKREIIRRCGVIGPPCKAITRPTLPTRAVQVASISEEAEAPERTAPHG